MIAIAFTFLAGRYHATPWDQHVNEGGVEWPPSPWRLVRSLVAASYKIVPDVAAVDVQRVLAPLLAPPLYAVPPIGEGHTRHYMPAPVTTTKVLDAFVVPGDGELIAFWPEAVLDDGSLARLDQILSHLTYLGRSESWVEARRVDQPATRANCLPCSVDRSNLSLPAVEEGTSHDIWCAAFAEAQHAVPKKERREAPTDWWSVLHQDTGRLRKEGWSKPPGMRQIAYRHEPARTMRRGRTSRVAERPSLVRYEIQSAVLPRLTEAVAIGDRFRLAALSHSDAHPTFLGRQGGQLREGHQHAYFLPSDDDGDGRIDHLLVYAAEGFDANALEALERVRRVWGHGGHDLSLTLTTAIPHSEFGEYGGFDSQTSRGRISQIGPARVWHSHTPFVPPRHCKRRRGQLVDTVEHEVQRLLLGCKLPRALNVDRIAGGATPARIDWHRFRCRRHEGGGAGEGQPAFGLKLTFEEPVTGPIALGYGSHHGLGLFVAVS